MSEPKQVPEITIDFNVQCRRCGRRGALENGLCLKCMTVMIRQRGLQSMIGAPCLRFVARGDIYRYRERLTSCGWYWDRPRGAWINESEMSSESPCIRAVAELPGATVTCEGPVY